MKKIAQVIFGLGVLMAVGYGGINLYIRHNIESFMTTLANTARPVFSLKYDGISSTMDGMIAVSNIRIRPRDIDDEVVIDSVRVHTPGVKWLLPFTYNVKDRKLPRFVTLSVSGVEVNLQGGLMRLFNDVSSDLAKSYGIKSDDVCRSPDLFHGLYYAALGYEKLRADLYITYEWLKDQNQWRIIATALDSEKNGFELESIMTLPTEADSQASQPFETRLVSQSITIYEQDLLNRVAAYCQKQYEMDIVALITAKVNADDKEYAKKWGVIPGVGLREAFGKHIRSGDPFTLTLKPSNAVGLKELQFHSPENLVAVLNAKLQLGAADISDLRFHYADFKLDKTFGDHVLAKLPELQSITKEHSEAPAQPAAASIAPVAATKTVTSEYRSVPNASLSKHVGRDIRISTQEGVVREGWLQNVSEKEATVSWTVGGGEMSAVVPFGKIKKAEVWLP